MTFSNAISDLAAGYACKRPSWRGYVYRDNIVAATDGAAEKYDIVFVNKGGTKFTYPYDTSSTLSEYSKFTKELMTAMKADDWITGAKDDFELARDGTATGDF